MLSVSPLILVKDALHFCILAELTYQLPPTSSIRLSETTLAPSLFTASSLSSHRMASQIARVLSAVIAAALPSQGL